jgi:hypothetical protein
VADARFQRTGMPADQRPVRQQRLFHRGLRPEPEGAMLPTEAEATQQRGETAQQRAERLAERLRQLGMDPD